MDALQRLARSAARLLPAAALAAMVSVAPAHAQQGGGQQGQGQQLEQAQRFQEVQQLQQQIRRLQQRLQQIRQQALRDTTLQRVGMKLQQTVRDAMAQLDSNVVQMEDSLNALQRQMNEARQSQDTARIREIMRAGQPLGQRFQRLRDSVLQRDSVRQMAQQFDQRVREQVAAINDSVPTLYERRDSLMQRLRELASQLRGQQQTPGGGGGQSGGQGGGGGK